MKKPSKKTVFAVFAAVVAVIILIVNYNTNYNWRYRDLIKKLTDVPNGDAITGTDFHAERYPFTSFTVHVSGKRLSKEEIYQMGYDIAERIDQHMHYKMKQTLSFYLGGIYLSVNASDKDIVIVCRRDVTIENGEYKNYTWIFEKYPGGEIERKVTPVIYSEGE